MRQKLKVADLRTIRHRTERIKELEAENAALLADLSRYSHAREMNADVACALRQRDDARKRLIEERAKSERYRKEALDALSKLAIAQLRAAIDATGEKKHA